MPSVISGKVQVDEDPTSHEQFHTLVLTSENGQNGVRLTRPEDSADEETRFVLIAGEPLAQPVVQYGPFVTTSNQEAMQAVMDFRMGRNGFEKAKGWESKLGAALRG